MAEKMFQIKHGTMVIAYLWLMMDKLPCVLSSIVAYIKRIIDYNPT